MSILQFQKQHSRNTHFWNYGLSEDGRLQLRARRDGVKGLIGIIVKLLALHTRLSKGNLVSHLRAETGNQTLTINDLSQPFAQMRKAGCLRVRGRSVDAVWSLTPMGVSAWKKASKKASWV